MEDVLDVYACAYDARFPVVCLDEKSKGLRGETRQPVLCQPGHPALVDSEYVRNGTLNLFVWVEPLTGRRGVTVTERRKAVDFGQMLQQIADVEYPAADKIVLVVDNLNTHGPQSLYEAFAPQEAHRLAGRFEWHYTPEHGYWLNIAECELSVLERQCLNRRIPDRQALEVEVAAWEQARNAEATVVRWQFTTTDTGVKLRKLYPQVEQIHNASG
jgi:hypothetical protein